VDLASVRGVDRKRARRLFDAGIESRADLRDADKSVMLAALRGREKTAETILENTSHRDSSMEGVDPSDEADYERSEDGGGRSEPEKDDDQASLGDR